MMSSLTPPDSDDDIEQKRAIPEHVTELTGLEDESVRKLVSDTCLASVAGFVFGGGLSIRQAADEFIAANKTTKFTNKYHMQGELNNAVLKRFMIRGSYWGWRTGAFVGMFNLMVQTLNHQRGKRDLWNVVAAGGTLGATFSIPNGPRAVAMGGLGAGALSLWFGLLLQGSWLLEGYVNKAKKEQEMLEAESSQAAADMASSA
eukprot:TRINITY_DN7483_c0_g1_i2.p1 TRINITY_DN7483_c0_g1~~TRINITY_DN7483_c0_g1_i2.p1  ORF type:complete len:203 (+),score=43.42 TRINITY_DN7483_c0_g1_i2:87-695(+)